MAKKARRKAKESTIVPGFGFTEAFASSATRGGAVQHLYWEKKTPGFGLQVGARTKTWYAKREVNGKPRWIKLGNYPAMKVEEARREAKKHLLTMEQGTDPVVEQRKQKSDGVTLRRGMAMCAADADIAQRTTDDAAYLLEKYIPDWLDRPIAEFAGDAGSDELYERHQKIIRDAAAGKHAIKDAKGKPRPHIGRKGVSTADGVMRHVRRAWNRARDVYKTLPPWPTGAVKFTKYKRRRAAIKFDDLSTWYTGIGTIDAARRDFLLVAILTGLRRNDVSTLRWENVDLKRRVVHIVAPKGGEPFDLPLGRRLAAILKARKVAHEDALGQQMLPPEAKPWCFGAWSASGHVAEPRVEIEGVPHFIIHGLRNSYITIAESLDISPYTIKALVNHAQPQSDVTGGYMDLDVERLRAAQQKIEDRIYKAFEQKPAKPRKKAAKRAKVEGNVVEFRRQVA